MNEDARERNPEQLNPQEQRPEQDAFSLEDIVREFGGWTQREESKTVSESMPQEAAQPQEPAAEQAEGESQPPAEQSSAAEEAPVRKSRFQFITMDLNAPRQPPEPETIPDGAPADRAAAESGQTAGETEQTQQPKLKLLPQKHAKPVRHPEKKRPKQAHVEPAEAYANCRRQLRGLKARTYFTLLLMLLCVGVTLWAHYGWQLPVSVPSPGLRNWILLGLLLACALFSADVLLRGIRQALRLRFNLESSAVLCLLAVLLDTLSVLDGSRIPLCAPVCLALALADWGRLQRLSADRKALRTVLEAKEPEAVCSAQRLWHDQDCLLHQPGDIREAADMLAQPDGCERVLRVYCPMSAVVSGVLSVVIAILTETPFFWVLAVLLTGSLPVMGFFSYALPWHLLSRRLRKSGAALLGWAGAGRLKGQRYLVVRGADLFPKANVSFNGLKVCGEYRVKQVVAFAGTVMAASGSELMPLFQDLMEEYGARPYLMGSFRRYEGGGFGAEIGGDVVLTGSQRFMQLMGVRIPPELDLKQAVYLSVNGELAGVFALSYKAAPSVRTGLLSLQHSKSLTALLATRDFLISPQMLAKKYKVAADRLEFPAVGDRVALSEPVLEEAGQAGAILSRGGFSGYVTAVLGARSLRSVTKWGAAFCCISGLVGLAIMVVLTRVGAAGTASAANLLQYMLLWLIPSFLLGAWVKK